MRFAIITDTHIGPSDDFTLHGECSLTRTVRLVQALNALPFSLDFVVHLGDVIHTKDLLGPRDTGSYVRAQGVFHSLRHPLHLVPGNHDSVELLAESFPLPASVSHFGEASRRSFSIQCEGYRAIFLDGSAPLEREPHGLITTEELAHLEMLFKLDSDPFVVFLHYPVLSTEVPWVDDLLLLENGISLHELLRNHQSRVQGVFFGHFHNTYSQLIDGVPYFGCGGSPGQVRGLPSDITPVSATQHPLSYVLVTGAPSRLTVRQILAD